MRVNERGRWRDTILQESQTHLNARVHRRKYRAVIGSLHIDYKFFAWGVVSEGGMEVAVRRTPHVHSSSTILPQSHLPLLSA